MLTLIDHYLAENLQSVHAVRQIHILLAMFRKLDVPDEISFNAVMLWAASLMTTGITRLVYGDRSHG